MTWSRKLVAALTAAASLLAASPLPAQAADANVYTTPGEHVVNNRDWRTSCGAYSSTIWRCTTSIWSTRVLRSSTGTYAAVTGWSFNNLTYLQAPKGAWGANPLANDGEWIDGGRRYRTECGTATTGPNACRTYILGSVVQAYGSGYRTVSQWVFNNLVLFGSTFGRPTAMPQCQLTVEGVPVTLGSTQQTVTVAKTSGTRVTVTMVRRTAWDGCGVTTVFRDTTGRIGYGGAVPEAIRRKDTGTTPQGTYSITEGFGLAANPATTLPYRRPTSDSYWVLDDGPYQNTWREGSLGGFDKSDSERLVNYPGQYDYVAVIDYNRNPVVKGKGGGIFLHVHGSGATAGCVSITATNMKLFLQTVTAGDSITIK